MTTNQHNQTTAAPAAPLDAKVFAIGMLSITACILFVGILLLAAQPKQAYAIGQHDRGGDFIMFTQQLSSSQEGVVVIDAASKRMTLYAFNNANKTLQVLHNNIPLDDLPGADRRVPVAPGGG